MRVYSRKTEEKQGFVYVPITELASIYQKKRRYFLSYAWKRFNLLDCTGLLPPGLCGQCRRVPYTIFSSTWPTSKWPTERHFYHFPR